MGASTSGDLGIAWPGRLNADVEGLRRRGLAWARERGLFLGPEGQAEYERMRFYDLIARAYPTVVPGTALDALVNLLVWFFPFDDGYAALPVARARAVACDYQGLVAGTRAPSGLMQEVFLEALQACRHGMSPAWRSRFDSHWLDDFEAHYTEVRITAAGGYPSPSRCLRVRRTTISLLQFLDLIEQVEQAELTPHWARDPHLAQMRQDACDILIYTNDLFSARKERADRDVFNLLLVLQAAGATHQEAEHTLHTRISTCLASFTCHRDALAARTAGAEPAPVRQLVCGLQDWIRGNLDWHRNAPRYRDEGYTTQSWSV